VPWAFAGRQGWEIAGLPVEAVDTTGGGRRLSWVAFAAALDEGAESAGSATLGLHRRRARLP